MHDLMNQHKLFLTGARKVLYFRWPRMNSPQFMSDDDTKRYIFKHFIHFKESCNIFFFCLPQLSDRISVRLLSGTSAILSFGCNNRSVQLPLSALSNINQSKDRVG